ncbi:MAG: Rieske 2Fe-2S domain-containing protein [Sinobacteraceae bacterium]|nr:Rieske 2Fe-2S domain-containing protein [Nevskiaceae bacterium]
MNGRCTGTIVCTLRDLEATGSYGFRIGDGDWPRRGFVVVVPEGGVRAYENTCPHAGHPLDLRAHHFLTAGRELIVCASHGALFAPDSGQCVAGPCVGRRLRPIEVTVTPDGEIALVDDTSTSDNARDG